MPFCKDYSYLCERVRHIILIEKVLNAWDFKFWAIHRISRLSLKIKSL